jgi:hypothetical protein
MYKKIKREREIVLVFIKRSKKKKVKKKLSKFKTWFYTGLISKNMVKRAKTKKKKIKTNSTTVFEVEQKLNVMMTSFNKCRIVKFKIQELLKN